MQAINKRRVIHTNKLSMPPFICVLFIFQTPKIQIRLIHERVRESLLYSRVRGESIGLFYMMILPVSGDNVRRNILVIGCTFSRNVSLSRDRQGARVIRVFSEMSYDAGE